MKDNKYKNEENNPTISANTQVVYRWNYGEQLSHDTRKARAERRRSTAVYATALTSVFCLCFAILIVVLALAGTPNRYASVGGNTLTTAEVAKKVYPSTVLILTANNSSVGYGSGFFLTSDGYIATNYHVIEGADRISVSLYNGSEKSAALVGYSKSADLAVLKISGTGYAAASIGNSDALVVGERAIAIGNPSGSEGAWTTTQGVISALDRNLQVSNNNEAYEMKMIQTDAQVNPGNSGGPLCNDRGEVIGIVTRKLIDYEGIGYAIPINGAMTIMDRIMKTGDPGDTESEISKSRPLLGITCFTVERGDKYTYNGKQKNADKAGVMVSNVNSDGAAYGILEVEDIIIAFNGKTVKNLEDMTELLYNCEVGDVVSVTVWRNGQEKTLQLTIGSADS